MQGRRTALTQPDSNYAYRPVDTAPLHHSEKSLFGIQYAGNVLTTNEFWLCHGNTFPDVLCGIFYLCWVPIPLAFAGHLFFKIRGCPLNFP